jgi:tetratricopeptide (TPR) repeat protein
VVSATPADELPPDVFISYARENRDTAAQLAEALAAQGLRVWWDRDLHAGSEFSEVIEQMLTGAKVVIALWSVDSTRSAFVRDESARALRAGKLLPVRIEDVELPLGFGQIHTLDLLDWDGDTDDEAFRALLAEVRRVPGRPTESLPARRFGFPWKLRRYTTAGVLACGLALLGWGGKVLWDKNEADDHFRIGLEHQHAKEPELENARNEFLSALERRPGHARARFYLARVYVLQEQPAAALESYQLALDGSEAPLDSAQRSEAKKQIVALALDPDEAAPVARSASTTTVRRAAPKSARAIGERAPVATAGAPGVVTRSLGGDTPPSTSRRPPRIDPPPATQSRLTTLVDGMFDDNKDKRISATTNLVVDPEALSDAVPLAVARALTAVRSPPLKPSESSGVVNTLLLLKSATPGTLEMNRAPIEALLAATSTLGETTRAQAGKVGELLKAAATQRPVAFIQFANEAQRPIAEAMAARFASFGYDTPGLELVAGRAPASTELRVHGKSDRSFARWLTRAIAEIGQAPPAVQTLRNVQPKTDAYEIWLERDLCAPGGRQLPACTAP